MNSLVSINILYWNDKQFIRKNLLSALKQTYDNIEINIRDQGSEDGGLELVKKIIEKSDVKINLIEGEKNIGFAPAHNQLIEKSKGDFILLFNSDAILEEDFVEKSVGVMKEDKQIAAIQPKVLKYDWKADSYLDRFDTTGLQMTPIRRIVNRGQGEEDQGQYDKPEEVFGADGALSFFRREALEDIRIPFRANNLKFVSSFVKKPFPKYEYLDTSFFAYKEDVDLAWRLQLYGWKIMYVPTVVAYHSRGSGESASMRWLDILEERRKISLSSKRLSFRNQRLMQIKNEFFKDIVRDFFPIFKKEVMAWMYVIFFEPRILTSLPSLIRLLPSAWRKREYIMANRRIGREEIKKWLRP